jgi:hypothetical protein
MVFALSTFSVQSQSKEIDDVSKTVLKEHLNDELYLQIRCFYDVRESIDDYILLNDKGKWRAEHRKLTWDPPEGYIRKEIITVKRMDESNIEAFLKAIDIDRLLQRSEIDSLSLIEPVDPNNRVLGGWSLFAIMICSKGTFRLIEYPFHVPRYDKLSNRQIFSDSYWQSAYLDNLLERFTQALHMENDRIYRAPNR